MILKNHSVAGPVAVVAAADGTAVVVAGTAAAATGTAEVVTGAAMGWLLGRTAAGPASQVAESDF